MDKLIEDYCRRVAEMPDRTSPDDWPEAMLITGDELAELLRDFAFDVLRDMVAARMPDMPRVATMVSGCVVHGDQPLTEDTKAALASMVGIIRDRMIVCPTCGNKRCPKATDSQLACTGSNEPGQPGSAY